LLGQNNIQISYNLSAARFSKNWTILYSIHKFQNRFSSLRAILVIWILAQTTQWGKQLICWLFWRREEVSWFSINFPLWNISGFCNFFVSFKNKVCCNYEEDILINEIIPINRVGLWLPKIRPADLPGLPLEILKVGFLNETPNLFVPLGN